MPGEAKAACYYLLKAAGGFDPSKCIFVNALGGGSF
jgi:hypothetical protein